MGKSGFGRVKVSRHRIRSFSVSEEPRVLRPHLRSHLVYVGLKFTSIPNKPAAGVGSLSLRSFNEFIFALCELLTLVKQPRCRYFTLEQQMEHFK